MPERTTAYPIHTKKAPGRSFSILDIMHRHVITVDAGTTARACAQRIANEHVGSLIVIDNAAPVGIITERSFVDLAKNGPCDPDVLHARDIMTAPLITISPRTDFSGAMRIFNARGIKRLPVVNRNRVVGLLTLANMIEYSRLKLAEKHRELQSQAVLDSLTGVYNKNAITKALKKEYERVRRFGGRTSVLFIDIDHFKQINDTWSHVAGDAILKSLGLILRRECREIDTVGRFGGEEFLVIAPNRKKYHAVRFGERLRSAVEKYDFKYNGHHIKCTISIGIASLFEGRDYIAALERADQAMYHAKNSGRNKVGLWRDGALSIAFEQSPAP